MIKDMAPLNVKLIPENGVLKYTVRSFSGGRTYQVVLNGPDMSFPMCQCQDWKRTKMPCKHIIGVFETVDGISWESLPDSYKQSPYFCLDNAVIGKSFTF